MWWTEGHHRLGLGIMEKERERELVSCSLGSTSTTQVGTLRKDEHLHPAFTGSSSYLGAEPWPSPSLGLKARAAGWREKPRRARSHRLSLEPRL